MYGILSFKIIDVVFVNAAQNNLNELDTIHERVAKIVPGGIRGVSSVVLFDELSWDTLSERQNSRKLCVQTLYTRIST